MKFSILAFFLLLTTVSFGQINAEPERWISAMYNEFAYLKGDMAKPLRSVRFEANYLYYQMDSVKDGELVMRTISRVDLKKISRVLIYKFRHSGTTIWSVDLDCMGSENGIRSEKTFPLGGTSKAGYITTLSLPLDEGFSKDGQPEKMVKAFDAAITRSGGSAKADMITLQ